MVLDGMSYEEAVACVDCYTTMVVNGDEFTCPTELGLPVDGCTISTDCNCCWLSALKQHYGK